MKKTLLLLLFMLLSSIIFLNSFWHAIGLIGEVIVPKSFSETESYFLWDSHLFF